MYNFSMLIAQHVKPKEKDLKYKLQINFTQAAKICLNFSGTKERSLLMILKPQFNDSYSQ